MPKTSNQKLKLFLIYQILNKKTDEQNIMTMSELIDELAQYGVLAERKTIYEDLEELRALDVDINLKKGKTTGYYIGKRDFELPELKLLVDIVGASKFITLRKSRELIRKLEGLASIYQAKLLQRQVHVADRVKSMNETIYYNVDMIYNGVEQDKKISFQYFEYTITKESKPKKNGGLYIISPFVLSWGDDNYYLIGYDSQAKMIKHYRVDKMKNIKVTKEPREGKGEYKKHDMSMYSQKFFGMFGGHEETVKLSFENSLIGVVIDRFGKDITIKPLDDVSFYIDLNLVISPQFFGWVAGFGGKAKILSPDYVTSDYKAHLRKALES